MTEEVDLIIETAKEAMQDAITHLEKELINIRAGKASPQMVMNVLVDYYGTMTPISQVANISTTDARTINIIPWEKKMIQPIEKAILIANIGFNPMNNGESVIINVPPLTEERRKELVKQAKATCEDAKIVIRNARQDANKDIKKTEISDDEKKNIEKNIQNLTDKNIEKIDAIFTRKEEEILTI